MSGKSPPTPADQPADSWLERLRDGSEEAVEELWASYFPRLVRLAERKLAGRPGDADGEEVALSAIDSLVRGAGAGRFDRLHDRDDLWKLLVTISARKAYRRITAWNAQKRGGGKVTPASALETADGSQAAGLDAFAGAEPGPQTLAAMDEQCSHLFSVLEDENLKRVARYKLEGYSQTEIAALLDCAPRTVRRYVNLIREIWLQERDDERA